MVNVQCPGCGAPYSVSEKRIPDGGLKMRCPKCGESFPVERTGGVPSAPPVPSGPPPRPSAPKISQADLPRRPANTLQGHAQPASQGLAPRGAKKPIFSGGDAGMSEGLDVGMPVDLSVDGLLKAAERATHHGGGASDVAVLEDIGTADVDDGFGALDLGIPGGDLLMGGQGVTDLPMRSLNEDLPMPASGADLPIHVQRTDLPSVPRGRAPYAEPSFSPQHSPQHSPQQQALHQRPHAPPPPRRAVTAPAASKFSDLPAVAHHADLPMPAYDADLPIVAIDGDLPVRAMHGDLPMAVSHADLPVPAQYGDLPLPFDQDFPIAADADLPLPHATGDLPIPADQDLPLPHAMGDLPLPADQDLPLPSPSGDLPLPHDYNLPTTIGTSGDDAIPLDADPHDQRFLQRGDFPGQHDMPPRREGSMVGDEYAIDQVEEGATDLLARDDTGMAVGDAPRVKLKKKKSNSVRFAVIAIPLLTIGGGLLTLTDLGPYGAYAISDALNAGDHETQLATFRQAAQEQLDVDTSAEAQALLQRAAEEQAQMPRFLPMTSYAAFVAFMSAIRFGGDLEGMAHGRLLIESIPDGAGGDLVALARAAHVAAEGQTDAALTQLAPLTDRMTGDIDVLVLAGEVALKAKQPKDALVYWKKASDAKKSARTLYGLARTQLALGQAEEAQQLADEVLKLSKNHAGARALTAELLWRKNKKDQKALQLLEEITKAGAVQSAASSNELVTAYSLLGDIQLSQSKLTAAEKSFNAALKLDPQSVHALVGQGELYFQASRYGDALARFSNAIKNQPDNLHAAIGAAKTKIQMERPKEARDELIAFAANNKSPLLGYWIGQSHESLGERDAAEKAYRAAIEGGQTDPDVVHAYVALATLLGHKGDPDGAAKTLVEATEKLPNSIELYNAKGEVALKAGRLDEAKGEFLQALKIDADNSRSRFRLAITLRRARDFEAAAREYDRVAAEDPEYPGLALERGLWFQDTGNVDKALEMYNDALKKAPEDYDLKLRVGSTQVISGHPQEAIKLLREVLAKRPTSAEVNHFLGRALLLAGESVDEALRFLQTAVQYDDNHAEYHVYVAWAANDAGQPSEAEKAVAKALALDDTLGDAYWQRGVLLQKRGQTVDALKELQKAVERNPSRFEAYATMARCYSDQIKWAEAEEAWLKAIAGNPNVAEWRFRLGKILMDRDAADAAAPHLLAAVELVEKSKKTPGWLWNVHWLVGEALEQSDPKRALAAYKEFMRLTPTDNAYREDARVKIERLEGE